MRKQLEQVREFNGLAGRELSDKPSAVDKERFKAQMLLIAEEVEEIAVAYKENNYVGIVDGLVDTAYVLFGLVELLGFREEFVEGFNLVHDNNMTKVKDSEGNIIAKFNENGKIIKPDTYKSIDLGEAFPHLRELNHVN